MFKLHGFPTSNYYNKVKLALLEKNLPFEEIIAFPSKEESFLSISPMGRIPILEYKGEFIRETHVIYELLEDLHPEAPNLLPKDPMVRARVREVSLMTDLYLDLSARPLFQHVFFGAEKPNDSVIEKAVADSLFGWKAMINLVDCADYAVGDLFSFADISAISTWVPVQFAIEKMSGKNLFEEKPEVVDYLKRISDRPHSKTVQKVQRAALRMAGMAKNKKKES